MHILHFRIGHVSFFLLLFCDLSLCNNLRISFLCISSIIALSAASMRENLLFHLSAIFRFAPRCFQYCQGFVKILNICFHILAVVATTHQFQMGDAGFLQPVQCTKSTSSRHHTDHRPFPNTPVRKKPRISLLLGLLPADSSIRDLLLSAGTASTAHDKDVQVRHSAENCRSFRKTGTVRSTQRLQTPSRSFFLLLSFRAAIMDAISSIVFFR